MKCKKILLSTLVLLGLACTSQGQKINGLSFVASPNKISKKQIIPVQKVSANYVSLMPFGFIRSLDEPLVKFNEKWQWFGETSAGVSQYADLFKSNDIQVMLKPQIWVHGGLYTGKIAMNDEESWKLLESSYRDFITTFAALAEKEGIPVLCIGTELEHFVQNRPEYWTALIADIRKIYSGKLTYAANWDEFRRVPFWGELDYIGVDAYFPLTPAKKVDKEAFKVAWNSHKEEIKAVREKYQKPVVFTEYGYRSVHHTGREPWDAKRIEGQVDLQAQQLALEALYETFWQEPWFAGGFVWKWFADHENVGGPNNNRFTPQNKPAEITIKNAYQQ